MSSFLSAAKNVARQRQNIRRYLINKEEESGAVVLALEGHNMFIPGLRCRGEMFVTVRKLYRYFYFLSL